MPCAVDRAPWPDAPPSRLQSRARWRTATPEKPKHIAFYGSFGRGGSDYALELKDALGYNTQLPPGRETLAVDGYHQHLRNPEQIKKYAEGLGAGRNGFRVCSFGDEISIGGINCHFPAMIRSSNSSAARADQRHFCRRASDFFQ